MPLFEVRDGEIEPTPFYKKVLKEQADRERGQYVNNVPFMLFNDVAFSVSPRALQLIMFFFRRTLANKGKKQASFTKASLEKQTGIKSDTFQRACKELVQKHYITTGETASYHEKTIFHLYNPGNTKDFTVTYIWYALRKVVYAFMDQKEQESLYKIVWVVATGKPKVVSLDKTGYHIWKLRIFDIEGEWLLFDGGKYLKIEQDRFVISQELNIERLTIEKTRKTIHIEHNLWFYKIFYKKMPPQKCGNDKT